MGAWRPKHVEWPCRNKTCTVLHQVGVSFDLYYDARKHKIKKYSPSFVHSRFSINCKWLAHVLLICATYKTTNGVLPCIFRDIYYLACYLKHNGGTAVAQWLRCCATNRKVTGSMSAGVIGFFIDIILLIVLSPWGVESASNRNEYQEYFLG